ncbi:ankyrin repeat-containing domain protein [Mycena vitilis]|nr:ankyrin repeat-containing domain protein [Mycena vitilis]
MDGLSIATAVVTFGELAKAIKESIDKVGENKKNLVDLQRQVEDTVQEIGRLAQGHGSNVPTGELLRALNNLTGQLNTVKANCQTRARTQTTGLPSFVKSWFKREKIEGEIKKLKENRNDCCAQFQLLSLTRVEGYAARSEGHAARMEGYAVRTETTTAQTGDHIIRIKAATSTTEGHTARIETNTARLITLARKEELQKWFQAIDMREKQRATHALRHSDTGRWVLEGTEFAKWKEEPGCLWIRGISGTGKSVLSSIAIDHLFHYRPEKSANMQRVIADFGIGYFYFDFRDEKKQLPENMLRSIIMQLSEQSAEPYSILDEQFKSCQGQIFPTYGDLLAMLETTLSQFIGTYIVLDALDECGDPDQLVKFISTLRGWAKPVHLLVASQPRATFVDSAVFEGALVVALEPATTHADILQFVNSELKLKSNLKHLSKYVDDITPKVVEKSNGMFRLAACLLQELSRTSRINPKLNRILDILGELPNDLFGIYTRFLQPINEDDFIYVAALLRWLAFSAEPVTLCQLDEALAINFSELNQWVFKPENREKVEDVCALVEGLVAVDPVSKSDSTSAKTNKRLLVTLAHSSVSDYIVSKQFSEEYKYDLSEAPSNTFLTQSCVTYLLHFENNPLNADTFPQYPLAKYAAKFWSHHLLRCHDRGVPQRSTMHLLQQGSQQYTVLNCVHDIDFPRGDPDWSRHAPWPLYLCSKIGYTEGVRVLLYHCGADVNTARKYYGSALQAAAWNGNVDVVRLLIEKGADVNTTGGEYGSALQGAAVNINKVDIVCTLLAHGADVNAMSGYYGSALQAAVYCARRDIVHALLNHGANVNAAGGGYGSALQAAAARGKSGALDIVRLLLDKGADVNAAGRPYGSALQAAAARGNADVVRLLLQKGADVNTTGGEYDSALQAAAVNINNVDIVCTLLEHGADVNAMSGYYGSALQAAVCCAQQDIVHALLNHGANVNAAGGRYGSVLQAAVARGNANVVRLLLEQGADVNAAGGIHSSALQAAATYGNVDIVRLLLQKGADVNTTGGEYGSALQAAARRGHGGIVRTLLEHGAGVNTDGGHYGSALQGAAVDGNVEVVRVLLKHGADVSAMGGLYSSALAAASANHHEEIAQLLREHGALEVAPDDKSH